MPILARQRCRYDAMKTRSWTLLTLGVAWLHLACSGQKPSHDVPRAVSGQSGGGSAPIPAGGSSGGAGLATSGGATSGGASGAMGGGSGGVTSAAGQGGAAGVSTPAGMGENGGLGGMSAGGVAGTAGAAGSVAQSGAASASMAQAGRPSGPVSNGMRGQNFGAGFRFQRGDATGAEQPSFDDSRFRALDVPHDFSIELAFDSSSPAGSGGGYLDGGVGWYRKSFTLDSSLSGERILIQFDGVYMNSQVWINGTSLGTRPYGYSSFEYDLTPYVKFDGSSNVLAVKVDNNQPNSRFYSGSGIYRNVWLEELAPIHVPNGGVFVTTPTIDASAATVSVSTDIQNQSTSDAAVTVHVGILDASGAVVAENDSAATNVKAAATSTVAQSLSLPAPRLWSPSAPYLYRVQVELRAGGTTVDTYVTSLGVRTPVFDPNSGFSLNGQNMKLQGVNMHHDLGALGTAVNYRAIERQVEILKGMGVNAIRTAHNPPAPELLDVADRLGVMILEEAFDTWTQPKTTNDYALYFNDWAERDIEDMVRRDRNHPSVILWSIGNEISGATTATAQKLKNWILGLDKTRAVTWASNKMAGPHYDPVDHDIAALLDVAGYNYAGYAGDYDADHQAHPTFRLLGTETSAAVRSRGVYHTPAGTVTKTNDGTSADRQCSSYDNETARFGDTAEVSYAYDADRPFVAGSFIWSGFDYIGEPTPYSSWPSKSSYFGAIDTAGFPKDVYYFYQSRWTSAPMVHLLPHWNWTNGTQVTVYAYTNCDSVELFLNDTSLGEKSLSQGGALHLEWNVSFAPGTLRADCKKNGAVAAHDTVTTAGTAAKVALSADRSPIFADGKDLVFVSADIQDANGVFVPTGDSTLTFSVTGPGVLVGVDNGNPIDTSSYQGPMRKAFNGKALAIVRANTMPGSIVVTATASGLTSAPLSVETKSAP
jgi:beta-galactosidase